MVYVSEGGGKRDSQMRSVLAIPFSSGFTDHLAHQAGGAAFSVVVIAVIDDVDDGVHLAAGDAQRGEQVDLVLFVQARDHVEDGAGVFGARGQDG